MKRLAAMLAGCAVAVSGCAVHGFKLPTGPAVPAPDGAAIWQQATSACRAATTFSAQLHVSGKAGGQRVRGTIDGAVTASDRIYLRANAPFGQTAFVLAGTNDLTSLLLPHDNRVVTAPAAELLEAITGLNWGPRDLLAVLAGCVFRTEGSVDASRIGDHLQVKTSNGAVFLRQRQGDWEVEGGVIANLTIGYGNRTGGWPIDIVITSPPDAATPIALKIGVEQIATTPLSDATFVLAVPSDAVPLSIDELRAMFGKGR